MSVLENNEYIDIINDYDRHRYSQLQNDPYIKGKPVIFMTTPRLNLGPFNRRNDIFFSSLRESMPSLYYSMTSFAPEGDSFSTSPFLKLLHNTFLGITGKDLVAKTLDVGETFYGFKQTMSGPTVDSVSGDTVSLKFMDYKYLPVVKMHKLWIEYREHVGQGTFVPLDEMRNSREIDFVSSLYYFVLDLDDETILYATKYTGIVPISLPYSELTASYKEAKDIPELTIEYAYSYKEDLTEDIYMDFNAVCTTQYENLMNMSGEAIATNIGIYNKGDSNPLDLYNNDNPSAKENHLKYNEKYTKSKYKQPRIVRTKSSDFSGTSIEPKVKFKLVYI